MSRTGKCKGLEATTTEVSREIQRHVPNRSCVAKTGCKDRAACRCHNRRQARVEMIFSVRFATILSTTRFFSMGEAMSEDHGYSRHVP